MLTARTEEIEQDDVFHASSGPGATDATTKIKQYLRDLIDYKLEDLPTGTDEISILIGELAVKMQSNVVNELDRCVNLSIEANETAIFSAQMLSDTRDVDHQTQNIAVAAEEMVATVKEIENYGTNIAKQAQEAYESTQSGGDAVKHAEENMVGITKTVEKGVAQVNVLAEFTDNIGGIATDIKKIAEHTNMLAINAMIEAARAGETGKGFAVIAGEVKSLAQKTAKSTEEISGIIIDLQAEMQTVLQCMDQSTEAVKGGQSAMTAVNKRMTEISKKINVVTDNTAQISNALSEQKLASDEVAQGISAIAASSSGSLQGVESIVNSMDEVQSLIGSQVNVLAQYEVPNKVIKLAKSDHVLWKKRLANMLAGREGLNPDELTNHHSCRLGKWYDRVDDPSLAENSAFKELMKPHMLVHKHGIMAARLYNENRTKEALREMTIVEDASREVLRLLVELENRAI